MDKLVTALAPVFAAGFAVQQLLEILTSILSIDTNATFQKWQKAILGFVSLVIGLVLAFGVDSLRVLQPLFMDPSGKPTAQINPFLDHIVTALVISAGTEGVNSILKFMKYAKEDKKNSAAQKVGPAPAGVGGAAAAAVAPVHATPSAALVETNRK